MTLTKIGASLGGSADIINVTQTSHTFVSNDRGKAVKMTNDSGTPKYMLATADAVGNADAIGIIINVADGNNFTIAVSGRITVDGCVPNEVAGTVLFLHTAATGGAAIDATDSGHLTSTEPSGNTEVSKPMAVITIANSEMIMIQQRGEVISTAGISIANDSVDSQHYAPDSIDNEHLADGAVDTEEIANDAVTADKLADSINTEIAANTAKTGITSGQTSAITANTAKVTNATHTGDVTGATSLTLAAGAVDIAHLSASGTKDSTTVLHGDNSFAAVSGIPSGAILMWHGLIANIPSGWVLCNGSNSTPDLRGQFVQGAAADGSSSLEAGATGGSATAAPGNHSAHSVTQPSSHAALASHAHTVALNRKTINNAHYLVWAVSTYGTGSTFTSNYRSNDYHQSYSTSTAGNVSESIAAGTPNAHSGSAVDAHSVHSTSDSRPPFYTILYIMKT